MAKMTLDELTKQLRDAFGAELTAVVLYGSAATGEHVAKKSDTNVLVIVDALGPAQLQRASATARAWTDAGNPAPLLLTREEWLGSADIFPMEYADVLAAHRALHGALPGAVTVDPAHLRLELEHEAMGTLLQLRRGYLAAGNDAREQVALLEASLSTVLVIFRAFLRLAGESPPREHQQVTQQAAARAGFDPGPFLRVLRHKRGDESLRAADASGVFGPYLEGLQQLVRHLDALKPGGAA
jgi:hypothetical protein